MRIGLSVLACLLVLSSRVSVAEQPNVVVVLTDDQGWGDLSLNGNSNLSTPNIDRLAAEGAQFDRFYVCPVCSPTRAEFLTGRYHPRSGVFSTSAGGERMDLDEVTIADHFRAAGYRTAAFGKWHNGMQFPYHPNGRGFDEFYGFCSGHWGDYFSPPLEHNGKIVQGEGFCIDDFTNRAISFIEDSVEDGRPFFAYLPFNTPHSPMQVPDQYWEKFKDANLKLHNREPQKENLPHVRCALAMCENIDWNVGRLMSALDRQGVADNTIVLYFCDNGPNGVRWNGGMKGRKGSTDEGGVRSPMLVRWPAQVAAGKVVTEIGAAIDLLPTLAECCGVKLQPSAALDGRSLAPLLTKSEYDWPDREILSMWRGKVSIRNQRFRLDHQGALFDIGADPGQHKNVAQQFPEVVEKLTATAEEYRREFEGYDVDERPFLLGHPIYEYTQVPARDASSTGSIERSNRFPNCSFLTNWTNTEDVIYWDVEVAASGTYEVELHYACRPQDVGSEVVLSLGEQTLSFRMSEAHDPPLRGQENDRVKRAESYVKDFKPVTIGNIKLEEGRGRLQLSAKRMAGEQVMDFRLLMFRRLP